MMKKITLLIVLLLAFGFSYGQTTLAEGDIVITGVNSTNNDQFSFVLLKDVATGTVINFTDSGWFAVGGFRGYNATTGRTGEGIVTWTATSPLTCGTVIVIEQTGTNIHTATNGTAVEVADLGFNLATGGDQLLAFQGSTADPTFIYAIHFANGSGWTDATGTNFSAVPAGLTEGINAIDIGSSDNAAYNCVVTTGQAEILAAVANASSNWNGSPSPTRQSLGTCSYTCNAPNSCASTVTWNGTWSGTPDLTTNVIIAANYNTNASIGSFSACSLTINTGITLTVNNSTYLEVENDVTVNGDLVVDTQGNFVQNDTSGTFTAVAIGGTSTVNKQTDSKPDWFYYTYWSSPVIGETIADAFPDVDGDRRFWFNAANFVDNIGGDDIDDNGDDWQYALGGNTMLAGVGYASTESRFHFPGATGVASFEGDFHTGDIPVTIDLNASNTGTNWNFIGNPYPSAIDFIAFQQANSSVIDGAAYFWSQAAPPLAGNPGNEPLNFNLNDYATFTVGTGGAAGGNPLKIPNGYVASAQGFFVPALTSGTATFTNAMRMADATSNNQFFRGNKSKKSSTSNNLENKIWINLTSGNGVFNQILVGYVDGATNDNDGMYYDAPKLLAQDYAAALYTLMETDLAKYVIQGKSTNSIDENEIIKLGFSTNINVATTYDISIAQLEGEFLTSNTVYLKDNLLNTLHNLSASDYTFTSEVGEFNDRFEIVFNDAALSTEDVALDSNTLKIIEREDDRVEFKASKAIKNIRIFDLLGRQLYDFKGSNKSETYNLPELKNTVYIARVKLFNGVIISKKVILKK